MSTNAHLARDPVASPQVMGELLHSLSQPLTSLRCALELSAMEETGRGCNLAAALEQTDAIIAIVCRMRDYVDSQVG